MEEHCLLSPDEGGESVLTEDVSETAVTEDGDGSPSPEGGEGEDAAAAETVDYAALAESDLEALRELFPETRALRSLSEMKNAERYGELRDLGLTPEEAYRAVGAPMRPRGEKRHMVTSGRRMSHGVATMPYGEMEAAKALFPALSSSEILSLYQRCTK